MIQRVCTVIACLLALQCAATTPQPATPERSSPAAAKAGPADPSSVAHSELASDVFLSAVADSPDTLLQRASAYLRPHLPAPMQMLVDPQRLKQQLFASMQQQLPGLQQALDTGRPVALALLDPRLAQKEGEHTAMGSLVAAVPVRSPDSLVDALAKTTGTHSTSAAGDHLFGKQAPLLRIRFDGGYALISSDQRLLDGAASLLLPLVRQDVPAGALRLRVEVARIYQRNRDAVDRGVLLLKSGSLGKAITPGLARLIGFVGSIADLALEITLKPTELHLRLAVGAEKAGSFPEYLATLDAGPIWGAKYLPDDSALAMLVRRNPAQIDEELDDMAVSLRETFQPLGLKSFADELIARWRKAIVETYRHLGSEQLVGLWATADGGIGAGGAFRLKDRDGAREAMRRLFTVLGKDLTRLLSQNPFKTRLGGASMRLKIRPYTVDGVAGEQVQIEPRWPRVNKVTAREIFGLETVAAARARLKELRAGFNKLFGRRLTLVMVYLPSKKGDVGLMTMGKDYQARIKAMIAVARGGPGGSLPRRLQAYAGQRRIVTLVYCPVSTLLEQGLRVATQLTTIPPQLEQSLRATASGGEAPIAGSAHLTSGELVLEGHLSQAFIGAVARIVVATAMQRAMRP